MVVLARSVLVHICLYIRLGLCTETTVRMLSVDSETFLISDVGKPNLKRLLVTPHEDCGIK
jgi:hypothetical protein